MYRRLSWSQGAVRLRVILGETGTHADQIAQQAIVWMFVIHFLYWHIPAGRVMQVVTESKSQYEISFYLPRLAKLVVDVLDGFWRLTKWSVFNPEMTLRDPDFCTSNRARLPLSLKLFGGGSDTEYMEPFLKEPAPAESQAEEPDEQPAAPTRVQVTSQPGWTPRLVADNAPVPYREPQGVDEIPLWVQGVGDTKSLFEGEDTEPVVLLESPAHRRPRPLQSS